MKGKLMKKIIYSVCIGTLALAVTAWGQQVNDNRRPARAKPQQRAANVHAARPANSGAMRAHNYSSTAAYRQRAQMTAPRTRSNAVVNQNQMRVSRERNQNQEFRAQRPASTTPATVRERNNVAVNRERNLATNRTRNFNADRNMKQFRGQRPTSVPPATADVNRFRNDNEFRNRNNVAINRNRNVTINRTQNAAFYRGGNARVTNNWRGDAFRGQRYAAFRNYNRQWHDRSWWRSHYTRIIFVNSGWWYWNAGYWFPAWGYAPSVSFVFDGPIYGYNGLSPDQVTVNVQQQLASDGYYNGPIDGSLGPMTREAIAAFQADNGLAVTSAIDEPTLATLGLV